MEGASGSRQTIEVLPHVDNPHAARFQRLPGREHGLEKSDTVLESGVECRDPSLFG